jgi:hypothetical protein
MPLVVIELARSEAPTAASGGQCGKEVLGPGFTVGAFFCRARFFHWNAGAAPLCRAPNDTHQYDFMGETGFVPLART